MINCAVMALGESVRVSSVRFNWDGKTLSECGRESWAEQKEKQERILNRYSIFLVSVWLHGPFLLSGPDGLHSLEL